MRIDRPSLTQTMVAEEIRRLVAEAIRDRACVDAAELAAQILKVYPTCGYDQGALINEVATAAVKASVAVKIDHQRAA